MDTAKRAGLYSRRTHAGGDLTPRGGDRSQLLWQSFEADFRQGLKAFEVRPADAPMPSSSSACANSQTLPRRPRRPPARGVAESSRSPKPLAMPHDLMQRAGRIRTWSARTIRSCMRSRRPRSNALGKGATKNGPRLVMCSGELQPPLAGAGGCPSRLTGLCDQ